MTDKPNPSNIVNQAVPEVDEGPLGLPYVKPKGAPDLPGSEETPDIVPGDF